RAGNGSVGTGSRGSAPGLLSSWPVTRLSPRIVGRSAPSHRLTGLRTGGARPPRDVERPAGVAAMKSKVQLDLVGRLPRTPGGGVGDRALNGTPVYVVKEEVGLQGVDVSAPAAPAVVGSYRPRDDLGPVAVSGAHACVVEKDRRLRVLDVSQPARP